jgi:NADPH:quinone reductase-like Zn-dependent oxidoreductase
VGEAPALADRLRTTAAAGSLIIARSTRRLVGGLFDYSFLFVHPDGDQLAEIGDLLNAGRIQPVIDKVFPFQQAKEALAYLEKGRAKGKVVVQMR